MARRITKFNNQPVDQYKSKLEKTCAVLLEEEQIPFVYEKLKFTLVPGFTYEKPSYERIGKKKKFIPQRKKVAAITYTPDFVGDGWIIETKGQRTTAFNIKWKLFKKYLLDHGLDFTLYMPTNKGEIIQTIELIKNGNSQDNSITVKR